MSAPLVWALDRARRHTLSLVAGVPLQAMRWQSAPGERHPEWLLGHLLLADTYLLFLLGAEPLPDDFAILLQRYGPASTPAAQDAGEHAHDAIERLTRTHAVRLARVEAMSAHDLAQSLPDAHLAAAQPTIGHHLQALVFHEGYHAGQLSAWRRAHGFAPVRWAMGAGAELPTES
jgi:hypothetical protein